MFKRMFLFLSLNILIVASVSILCDLIGLRPYISRAGLDLESLAMFCLIWGMTGAFISLLLSKKIAKWMLNLKILHANQDLTVLEERVFVIVRNLSMKARLISVPEVGIWQSGQSNAFATGASRNSSLIAVSSTLLETLTESELEAVIAHEMAHITNGDMVTMALLQGVVNSFVMFLSRICAYAVTHMASRDSKRGSSYFSYALFTMLFEMIFLSLASLLIFFVSRKREFAADRGGAKLVGRDKMISALRALEKNTTLSKKDFEKQKSLAAMMVCSSKKGGFSKLFATHPTIEERITYLESLSDYGWNVARETTF